jgi:hypothetical protein
MTATTVSAPVSPTIRVFTEEPDSSFTGMIPAYLERTGKVQDETSKCEDINGSIAALFKFLNEISLKSASLDDILKKGKLACITYDKGVIKSIAVYQVWVETLVKAKTSTVLVSSGGTGYSIFKNAGIQKLSLESYSKMARLCVPLLKV